MSDASEIIECAKVLKLAKNNFNTGNYTAAYYYEFGFFFFTSFPASNPSILTCVKFWFIPVPAKSFHILGRTPFDTDAIVLSLCYLSTSYFVRWTPSRTVAIPQLNWEFLLCPRLSSSTRATCHFFNVFKLLIYQEMNSS